MNPQEFSWTEDQQVTVTNPTTETFKFKVHSKEYELGAGKTAKMPGYIAWVYVYNQAVSKAQADGVFNRWNEEDFRPSYYEKFVVGTDNLVQTVEEQPQPQVEEFDEPAHRDQEPAPLPAGGSTYDPETEPAVAPMKPAKKATLRGRSARV